MLAFDLMRKSPSLYSQTVRTFGLTPAKIAVSGACAFGLKSFIDSNQNISYCDAPPTWSEDPIFKDHVKHVPESMDHVKHALESKDLEIPAYIFETDSLYTGKHYNVELKPLLSAFHPRSFMLTTMRSFLMFYLPLLEPNTALEEDDEDFLAEKAENKPVDLVTPFHKSVKQIVRETSVVTTRRALERLVCSYVSQRMACKLLKDAPRSAMRKAHRGLPTTVYFHGVMKTTLRAHCLGVAASWTVQVGIDIYKALFRLFNSKDELEDVDTSQELKLLCSRIYGVTVRSSASLLFATIGAGIGATCLRPSLGQWIGCSAGDMAGPVLVALLFDRVLHE